MSSPTPSYIPYTPKRHSTQSSIASLSQIQHNPSSSSSSSSSRAPSHHRTSSSQSDNNNWLKSPQPQRYSLERPLLVNQHHWNSQSSSQSTITTTGTASYQRSPLNAPTTIGSPIPHNTLPFSPSPRLQAPPQPSTSTSPSPSSSTTPHQSTIPYLTSFQPPGVKRNRTEQFIKLRQGKRRETLGEEERLERRLDKLLELHFPPATDRTSSTDQSTTTTTTTSTTTTSTFGSSLSSLASSLQSTKSAKDLFQKTLLANNNLLSFNNTLNGESSTVNNNNNNKYSIEKEEQKLVKWREDKFVKECEICQTKFGLLTRKHHCRLCGRIICFLPPTPTTTTQAAISTIPSSPTTPATNINEQKVIVRRERCSTFFTYIVDDDANDKSVRGVEKGSEKRRRKGLIVEIAPVEEDRVSAEATLAEMMMMTSSDKKKKDKQSNSEDDKKRFKSVKDERRKVRICRDCLNTVLRHQLSTVPVETPNWLKLYKVLKQLELEIEQSLLEFQELALQLRQSQTSPSTTFDNHGNPPPPPPSISQTSSLRARLLTNLASYDTLSKRLLALSSSSSASRTTTTTSTTITGGELERLQKALGTRSMNWLSEKLALLRSLGSIEEISGKSSKRTTTTATISEGGGGEVKSLESLLNQDELRKVRERIGEVGVGEAGNNGKLLRLGKDEEEERGDGQLGVLLEQEKLVQSYLEDANSRRQFEDAASLQASLDELRGEIERMRIG